MILGRIAVYTTFLLALAFTGSAGAVTITEFESNPGKVSLPEQIVAGPGGLLWWTEGGAEPGIGRMTTNGEHIGNFSAGNPKDLVAAPSGWVSWLGNNTVGTRSPLGVVSNGTSTYNGTAITLTAGNEVRVGGVGGGGTSTRVCTPSEPGLDHITSALECSAESSSSTVEGLAASAGNTLWASLYGKQWVKIFSATPLSPQKVVELPAGSGPRGIAIGPEGDAWVAMWLGDAIDRIAPDGSRTRFSLPPDSAPFDIVFGPDGAFWITESGTGKIARMTTAGLVTNEYPVPSGETFQTGITVGPDGNIWFSDTEMGLIGRLIPDPLPVSGGGGGGGAPGNVPGPGPAPDKTVPRFTAAPNFSPARFRVAGAKAASSRGGAPTGSTLTFSLSEDASVTATVAIKAPGRRSGKACVAPGKAKPGAAICSRYLPKGKLNLAGRSGANKVSFSGKVAGKVLRPGTYQASFVARDPAGNSSVAATAHFTIAR